MTTPTYLTWDGDPANGVTPRRPSTDDLGGDEKLDDDEYPPDEREHPTADGWNSKVKNGAAVGRVMPGCLVDVDFSAGAPFIARVSAASTLVVVGSFTVTNNGDGDTTIEWNQDLFPPEVCRPSALTLYGSGATALTGHIERLPTGVRVRTFDAGTLTDIPFAFHIN